MKKNYPYIYKDLLQMLKFAVYELDTGPGHGGITTHELDTGPGHGGITHE